MFIFMNTVHERLRHLRENVKGLPLREFRARINAELADEEQLSRFHRSSKEGIP